MNYLLLIGVILVSACAHEKQHEQGPAKDARLSKVSELQNSRLTALIKVRDPKTGWPLTEDCDAMLWVGKYAGSFGVEGVDLAASEFADEPGRFGRRPPPYCWTPEDGDQGSKTTWSRDMGVGLILGAVRSKNLSILERHSNYGESNKQVYGKPFDDGRVLYTPAIQSLLYGAIHHLGGRDNPVRKVPNVYISGLLDYQAHLQILDIDIRATTESGIRPVMKDRIIEHAKREPENVYYQVMRGRFTGDFDKAIELCLMENPTVGGYVRCETAGICEEIEVLYSCGLLLNLMAN